MYYEGKSGRTIVDRQIDAYRLYGNRCLIYEAPRKDGRFLFVAWSELSPIAFRPSSGLVRWRLDVDGPRRFEVAVDADGRRLLDIEWINYGDACYLAQLQPRLREQWQESAPFDSERVKSEQSRLDVDGEDSIGNSTLSDAAREGRIAVVDELLRAGSDVNSANRFGVSVLMTAVGHGNVDVVRRLIAAGARVNAQDGRGATALMYAARYRKVEIARLLVASGAKIALRDDAGRTAAVWLPESTSDDVQKLRALLDEPRAADLQSEPRR